IQAFVSTLLKQLASPPFLPQLCSTRAKLVIVHSNSPQPSAVPLLAQSHTRKITEALTVNLPAFLLSKSNNPDPVRAPRFPEAFSGCRISNFETRTSRK